MKIEQMRVLFESMYRSGSEKLARGKYLRQDYDHTSTQANWELFQMAWPIIFAAGMERAAAICDAQAQEPECPERATYCAAAIRAEKEKTWTK